MGEVIKENHGSDTPAVSQRDNGNPLRTICSDPRVASQIIVAVGTVLNSALFIYLSFQHHPDASNLAIPLILKPSFDYLAKRWKERKNVRPVE